MKYSSSFCWSKVINIPCWLQPYGLENAICLVGPPSINSLFSHKSTMIQGYISHLEKHQRGPQPISTKHHRKRRYICSFKKGGNPNFHWFKRKYSYLEKGTTMTNLSMVIEGETFLTNATFFNFMPNNPL